MEQYHQSKSLQIYPIQKSGVPQFWVDKYEKNASTYWDIFYKRHEGKFFKDRHYLRKEFSKYFSSGTETEGVKVILEVGCGVGNTMFPLIKDHADIFIYACDFSPRAIDLVKMHSEYEEDRIKAFVCDVTEDDLDQQVPPNSVDIVTMIFFLSALSPDRMRPVLENVKKVLKPNGCVLFRDYAAGDLSEKRFAAKDRKIGENYYVRGDGTRSFFFSNEFLVNLFEENGFYCEDISVYCKDVENRSKKLLMSRRWVQAVFIRGHRRRKMVAEDDDDGDIDLSEGLALEMFGDDGVTTLDVEVGEGRRLNFVAVPSENQHTCRSTGMMVWESAFLMASVLDHNAGITASKTVLELGCGCAGVCAMAASRRADLVVATDGDPSALRLLARNVETNIGGGGGNLIIRKLEWGDAEDVGSVKRLSPGGVGFDVIIGTDVIYDADATLPLFATAHQLIAARGELILCHVYRRVHESCIISAASRCGFDLLHQWRAAGDGPPESTPPGIANSWILPRPLMFPHSDAVHIMYFRRDRGADV